MSSRGKSNEMESELFLRDRLVGDVPPAKPGIVVSNTQGSVGEDNRGPGVQAETTGAGLWVPDQITFAPVLQGLLAHLLRRATHEPGLFRNARGAAATRALWTALSLGCAQRSGHTYDGTTGAAWVVTRLAEESDHNLAAAALLLHLKTHPPLIPSRLFPAIVAAATALDSTAPLKVTRGASTDEATAAALRMALYDVPLPEWRLLRFDSFHKCEHFPRLELCLIF